MEEEDRDERRIGFSRTVNQEHSEDIPLGEVVLISYR